MVKGEMERWKEVVYPQSLLPRRVPRIHTHPLALLAPLHRRGNRSEVRLCMSQNSYPSPLTPKACLFPAQPSDCPSRPCPERGPKAICALVRMVIEGRGECYMCL